jgi:phospholipid transport system substrate-binding protein
MKRWIAAAVALTGILLTWSVARAGSPTEQLRGFFVATSRILDPETQEKPEERFNAIRLMVHDIVDFPEAARLSLGPNWSVRTSAERDEFVPLFADLLERSLIAGIAARIRLPDGVKVSYLGESIDGVMATVWTTIASRSGLDLPFKYQMIQRRDQWAVRDVMIDGVSVAANYRAQFTRVMQLSSYAELVRTNTCESVAAAHATRPGHHGRQRSPGGTGPADLASAGGDAHGAGGDHDPGAGRQDVGVSTRTGRRRRVFDTMRATGHDPGRAGPARAGGLDEKSRPR